MLQTYRLLSGCAGCDNRSATDDVCAELGCISAGNDEPVATSVNDAAAGQSYCVSCTVSVIC